MINFEDNFIRKNPFPLDSYDNDLKEFFGKNIDDFNKIYHNILNGKDIAVYMQEQLLKIRESGRLNNKILTDFYSNEIYLAGTILHTQPLGGLPSDPQLGNEYEFLEPAYQHLIKSKRTIKALDHGTGSGWQGLLLWRLGYVTTFSDLPTPYFKFLQYRCKKYNLEDVNFIDIVDTLNLKDRSYDFVNSFFVFEHILHPLFTLKEIITHMNHGALINLRTDFAGDGMHLLENHLLHPDVSPGLWEMILSNYGLEKTQEYGNNIRKKVSFL